MIQVVCEPANKRPPIATRLLKNEYLQPVVELMMEGWSNNPKARPSARKMKKDIGQLLRKCYQELMADIDTPLSPLNGDNPLNKRAAIYNRGSMGSRTSDYETDRGTNASCSSGRTYGGSIKRMTRDSPTLDARNEYTEIKNKTAIISPGSSDGSTKKYFNQSLQKVKQTPWMENQKNSSGMFII